MNENLSLNSIIRLPLHSFHYIQRMPLDGHFHLGNLAGHYAQHVLRGHIIMHHVATYDFVLLE